MADLCQGDVEETEIIFSINSNQSAITLRFNNTEQQTHDPPYWKLNASLLDDDNFVELINESVPDWIEGFEAVKDKRVLCDLTKYRIRQFTINFSKERARNRREKIADIKTSLKQCTENCSAHLSLENIERLENLKAEYNHIFDYIYPKEQ